MIRSNVTTPPQDRDIAQLIKAFRWGLLVMAVLLAIASVIAAVATWKLWWVLLVVGVVCGVMGLLVKRR